MQSHCWGAVGSGSPAQGAGYCVGLGLVVPGHRVGGNHQEREVVVGDQGAGPVVARGHHQRRFGVMGHCVNAAAIPWKHMCWGDGMYVDEVLEVEGPKEDAAADLLPSRPTAVLRPCCRVGVRQQQDGHGVYHLGDLALVRPPLDVQILAHLGLWGVHC